MKANELRQGNIIGKIFYNPNPKNEGFEVSECTVVGILNDTIYFKNKGDKRTIKCGIVGFQPIPLTEEILLKCGFKNYENECSWIKQGIKIFEDENGHYIFFDHDIHLNSLHQLQNLYFALTGQELEINL